MRGRANTNDYMVTSRICIYSALTRGYRPLKNHNAAWKLSANSVLLPEKPGGPTIFYCGAITHFTQTALENWAICVTSGVTCKLETRNCVFV